MAKDSEKNEEKAVYEKPNSTLDLEARQEEDYVPASRLAGSTSVSPLDRAGFIGVDPVYQNAANEVDRPITADEGAEYEAAVNAGVDMDEQWEGGDDGALPDNKTHDERVKEEEKRQREEYEERKAKAEEHDEPVGPPPASAQTSTPEGGTAAKKSAPSQQQPNDKK